MRKLYTIILVLILLNTKANANVVLDTFGTALANGSSSIAPALTITTQPNRYLVCLVTWENSNSTVSTVKLDGTTSLTSEGTVSANNAALRSATYYDLINPPSGAHTVTVTFTTSVKGYGPTTCVDFYGVNQTTPYINLTTNFGSATNATITLTNQPGNIALTQSVDNNSADASIDAGWTLLYSAADAGFIGGSSAYKKDGTSLTRTDTLSGTPWGMIGASVNALVQPVIIEKGTIVKGTVQ